MARARNIKPSFFDNDLLAECEPLGRLLFIGLWTICDFNGNLEWRSKRVKKQLLAYDNCDIDTLAINLDKSGFIRFYSDQENMYVNIVNFNKHQNPHKNERAKGSEIPTYTNECRQAIDLNTLTINRDKSGLNQDCSTSNPALSLIPDPDSPILNPDPLVEHFAQKENCAALIEQGFDIFYSAGLVKKSKKSAFDKFKLLVKNMKADPIELGELLKTDVQARVANNQFGIDKLHPATYLNQQRWEDDNEKAINGFNAPNRKLSASERVAQRNEQRYGTPSSGLRMATDGGHIRGAVDQGERGRTFENVDSSSEQAINTGDQGWDRGNS